MRGFESYPYSPVGCTSTSSKNWWIPLFLFHHVKKKCMRILSWPGHAATLILRWAPIMFFYQSEKVYSQIRSIAITVRDFLPFVHMCRWKNLALEKRFPLRYTLNEVST
jgi:hypothetical protein